jgi:hypothetical protein
MHRFVALATCCYLCLVAVTAQAEGRTAGWNQHDGFFVRWTPGLAAASASENPGGGEQTLSGSGFLGGFAVGGTIMENLILHFSAHLGQIAEPKYEAPGISTNIKKSALGLVLFGGGLTRYWMPYNVYATVSAGLGGVVFVPEKGQSSGTERGLGLSFMVGKEWWASENWGLGIAGQYLFISAKDKDLFGTKDLTSSAFGLVFSATYN